MRYLIVFLSTISVAGAASGARPSYLYHRVQTSQYDGVQSTRHCRVLVSNGGVVQSDDISAFGKTGGRVTRKVASRYGLADILAAVAEDLYLPVEPAKRIDLPKNYRATEFWIDKIVDGKPVKKVLLIHQVKGYGQTEKESLGRGAKRQLIADMWRLCENR